MQIKILYQNITSAYILISILNYLLACFILIFIVVNNIKLPFQNFSPEDYKWKHLSGMKGNS